jgi:hypothetical protein
VVDRRDNVTRIDQRTTGDLWEEIAPNPVPARSEGVAIILKRIIVAGALALISSGAAGAGGAATPRPPLPAWQLPGVSTTVSTTPGFFTAVQACEAEMRRMAGLNTTLAANYNCERVYDECVSSTREAVASK